MAKLSSLPPLFSEIDRRRLIPLNEVAKVTGLNRRTLTRYAKEGSIPGARQVGPGFNWFFDRQQLEKWWQEPKRIT
jgi:excisionase family DNA binding protein